ncbi:MAG TPA: WYL domain-containing protein [Chitinispirillaceae bacterium]|nr:WYL domain-containing protein [Chitinispirillaceae bacterium]
MKRKDDAEKLVEFLTENPQGVSKRVIMRECAIHSKSSFFEILKIARKSNEIEVLKNGYYRYVSDNDDDEPKSLMSLHDDELMALFAIKHILSAMTSDLLRDLFDPLQKRFTSMLDTLVKDPDSWESRIRILDIHFRSIEKGTFTMLTMAIARKRVITFEYTDSSGSTSSRIVSPQQLARYKDNWYLDAWCHSAAKPRIFSLDMIKDIHYKNSTFHSIDTDTLRDTYATSYGIFSGKPTATAVINFTGKAARYVKREQWHPQQQFTDIDSSTVQLRIPFNNPTELICMILYWGSEAEVIGPQSLRDEIAAITKNMMEKYKK